MRSILITALILLALPCMACAAGVWQYCGSNSLSVTITLSKEAVTGHVLVLASTVPNPPTSVDLLISADPSASQRWHMVDRESVPGGGGDVNLECDIACIKNAAIIYFIVDDSADYTKRRRPCS